MHWKLVELVVVDRDSLFFRASNPDYEASICISRYFMDHYESLLSFLNTASDTFLYPDYTALNRKENINVLWIGRESKRT